MAWSNGPFTVWHGTVSPCADAIVRSGINLGVCKDEADFGRGFYVTRIRDHAVIHANERYSDLQDQYDRARRTFTSAFDPVCAAVIEFTVSLDRLSALAALAFVEPIPEWLEFVRHCRQPSRNHKLILGSYYDVVFGPMFADGAAIPDREQISFHTTDGIGVLRPVSTNPITRGGPIL
jgi:hypothetical protein